MSFFLHPSFGVQPWRKAPPRPEEKLIKLVSLEALCNAHYQQFKHLRFPLPPDLQGTDSQKFISPRVVQDMLHPSWQPLLPAPVLHARFVWMVRNQGMCEMSLHTQTFFGLGWSNLDQIRQLQNQLLMNGELEIDDIVSQDPFADHLL